MGVNTYKVAAIGRLMLREFDTWNDFRKASQEPAGNRQTRRATASSLGKNVRDFLGANFEGAGETKLARLWSDVSEGQGLRLHMPDFEKRYFRIKPSRRKSVPDHAVVDISLWGLGFDFPEKHFAESLGISLRDLNHALVDEAALDFNLKRDRSRREEIRLIPRRINHYSKSVVLFAFSLAECFVNGIAWSYLNGSDQDKISATKKRELSDKKPVSIKKKLTGFDGLLFDPEAIGLTPQTIDNLESAKDYRDSIAHPSPFEFRSANKSLAPFEKLERVYELTPGEAVSIAAAVGALIQRYYISNSNLDPWWLESVKAALEEIEKRLPDAADKVDA